MSTVRVDLWICDHNLYPHGDAMCHSGGMSSHIHDGQLGASRRGASRRSSAPRTLTTIMGALGVSDIELARRTGETRQNIHKKRTGRSALTADQLDAYATALDVEPEVLLRRPSAALAWLAEHRAATLDDDPPPGEPRRNPPRSRCTAPPLTPIVDGHIVSIPWGRAA